MAALPLAADVDHAEARMPAVGRVWPTDIIKAAVRHDFVTYGRRRIHTGHQSRLEPTAVQADVPTPGKRLLNDSCVGKTRRSSEQISRPATGRWWPEFAHRHDLNCENLPATHVAEPGNFALRYFVTVLRDAPSASQSHWCSSSRSNASGRSRLSSPLKSVQVTHPTPAAGAGGAEHCEIPKPR
jgi:hypothetical protein